MSQLSNLHAPLTSQSYLTGLFADAAVVGTRWLGIESAAGGKPPV